MVIATSHGEQPIDHNEMNCFKWDKQSNENIRNYTVCTEELLDMHNSVYSEEAMT